MKYSVDDIINKKVKYSSMQKFFYGVSAIACCFFVWLAIRMVRSSSLWIGIVLVLLSVIFLLVCFILLRQMWFISPWLEKHNRILREYHATHDSEACLVALNDISNYFPNFYCVFSWKLNMATVLYYDGNQTLGLEILDGMIEQAKNQKIQSHVDILTKYQSDLVMGIEPEFEQ